MKLRFYAFFRDIVGKPEIEWTRPTATLGDLLRALCVQYGKEFSRWCMAPDGSMSELVIIIVNGKDARDLQRMDTPLKPDDTVVIFPPLAGG